MPTAYSYVRFSSTKQALGDSLRRQVAMAEEYAAEHGLTLDTSLRLRDLGISAFDSSNVRRGALGAFLEALQAGKIPIGSYLLVEQLDRLSRQDVFSSIRLLEAIVEAGVILVTLQDKRVFDKKSIKELGNIMMSVAIMFRAHEESANKSDRLKKMWNAKRDDRPAVLTAECPRWLKAKEDRSGYEVIPEKAESVKRVFELTASGFGNVAIARKANLEKWPTPGNVDSWHPTLVTRILNNRAVLGEFQPHISTEGKRHPTKEPWLNYYPAVVEETLFARARAAKAMRAQLPRRRDNRYLNIFQGVLKCGGCGASLCRKYKGSQVQPNYVQYLCSNRIRAETNCPSISAIKLTEPTLRAIFESGFVEVAHDDFVTHFREEVVTAKALLDAERARAENVLALLEVTPNSPMLANRFRELELSTAELQARYEERIDWLAQLSASVEAPSIEGDLSEALTKLTEDAHIEFRASLHERITSASTSIYIYPSQGAGIIVWRGLRENTKFSLTEDALAEGIELTIPPEKPSRRKQKAK